VITFNVGDLIYFVGGSNIQYGAIQSVNGTSPNIVYTVQLSNGSTQNVNQADAYPSPNFISSPTPTPSVSNSVTPSATPLATPTPTISPTPQFTPNPNQFSVYDAASWTSPNGSIVSHDDALYYTVTSTMGPDTHIRFGRQFTVVPNREYKFHFDYEQGTIRYAKIKLKVDQGMLFGSNRSFNHGDTLMFGLFGDSGRFEVDLYTTESTLLDFTLEFFTDSNFDHSPRTEFDYRLTNTLFQEVYNTVTLTPTPTVSPTPQATVTPSVTLTQTPNYIPLTCYGRLVIGDTPLVYYKFDERLGTPAVIDYSGNNINGSYHNVQLEQPPIVDGAGFSAAFGGASPSYVVANNDNRYKTIYGDLAVEFSLLTSQAQGLHNVIFSLPISGDPLTATINAFIDQNGYLNANLTTFDGIYTIISDTPVTDGVKRMFSITRSGNVFSLYVNSVIVDQITATGQN